MAANKIHEGSLLVGGCLHGCSLGLLPDLIVVIEVENSLREKGEFYLIEGLPGVAEFNRSLLSKDSRDGESDLPPGQKLEEAEDESGPSVKSLHSLYFFDGLRVQQYLRKSVENVVDLVDCQGLMAAADALFRHAPLPEVVVHVFLLGLLDGNELNQLGQSLSFRPHELVQLKLLVEQVQGGNEETSSFANLHQGLPDVQSRAVTR